MNVNRPTGSSRVIVALDFESEDQAYKFVSKLEQNSCRLKVGLELFVSAGPSLVESLVEQGFDVFLDLKFHDIPNTVAKSIEAACRLGVWMVNVHASGGRAMLEAATNARINASGLIKLVAVTMLTSLSDNDLRTVGIENSIADQAMLLASEARSAGLDGVVCSGHEASWLRTVQGKDFLLVTPGIRFDDGAINDQKRVMTPIEALKAGSDYLVIGRPITQAPNPAAVIRALNLQLPASG